MLPEPSSPACAHTPIIEIGTGAENATMDKIPSIGLSVNTLRISIDRPPDVLSSTEIQAMSSERKVPVSTSSYVLPESPRSQSDNIYDELNVDLDLPTSRRSHSMTIKS